MMSRDVPEKIVVIGGNAAGMTAASRAKRLRPELDVTILEGSRFISYSICGVPYLLAGLVGDHQRLLSFDPESLWEKRGIRARTGVRVEQILPGRRRLLCRALQGEEFALEYDRLVICTGYRPRTPGIEGTELEGVFTVSRLEDGLRLREAVRERECRRVAVVGGGYIGLMMVDALRRLGLEVLLIERRRHVFPQVDEDVAELLEKELRRQGVEILLGSPVEKLEGRQGRLWGVRVEGQTRPVDLALVDVGVLPNVELAVQAGIPCGVSGAIEVDERGQTALPAVYAAGNCAQTIHRVSGRPIFSTLGTTAAHQGRVVGENLAGLRSLYPGSLETTVEKIFDLAVARTGLTLRQALQAGFEAEGVLIQGSARAGYYPGSAPLWVKLVFERRTGRLLGGQMLGEESCAKRIDTLVAALSAQMDLQELAHLDLAYAPPFATLWDPIQIAANIGLRKVESRGG